MVLAQGLFWRASLEKGGSAVELELNREMLADSQRELRDLRIAIPLEKWNRVLKHARSDRKLLGGVLLDFATPEDHVSAAVGSDRLFGELQRVMVDATASLVESGALALTVVDVGAD